MLYRSHCRIFSRIFIIKNTTSKNQRVQTVELWSRSNNETLPYRIILPSGYFATDRTYPVFYLMHGLFGSYENWTELTDLVDYTEGCGFIIVCPEGKNSWYTDNPQRGNHMFESYVLNDLINDVEKKFRVKTYRRSRVIGGLSMGGYGAIKFAFRHPDLFCAAFSMSGALDVRRFLLNENGRWNELHPFIAQAFEGMTPGALKHEDLFYLAENIADEMISDLPSIYIDCGLDDSFIDINRAFSDLLNNRNIKHIFVEASGGHDWDYWDRQIKNVLRIVSRNFDTDVG
ncbi:MAG: alpha/beta hydrolase family protein [Pyrinomonadaceae bacterium]